MHEIFQIAGLNQLSTKCLDTQCLGILVKLQQSNLALFHEREESSFKSQKGVNCNKVYELVPTGL